MTNTAERRWRIEESEAKELNTIQSLMNHWGISKRTASEYLEVIEWRKSQ